MIQFLVRPLVGLLIVALWFFAAPHINPGKAFGQTSDRPASEQSQPAPVEVGGPGAALSGSHAQTFVPHELSPWSMFLNADVIVQGVMVGLTLASIATWTIFFGKLIEMGRARRRLANDVAAVGPCRTLAEGLAALPDRRNFLAGLLNALASEINASDGKGTADGVKERAVSLCAEIARDEAGALRRGMGILATIGSTAPFIGLFGTVWGIMNSFIGISKSQTTNLAVVAPGIAEALLATAFGLVAAIPAVIIYNVFARSTRSYAGLVASASGLAQRILSMELDRLPVSRRV